MPRSSSSRKGDADKDEVPAEEGDSPLDLSALSVTYTILAARDSHPFEHEVVRLSDLSVSGVTIFVDQEILTPTLMQLSFSVPTRPFHVLVLAKAVQCQLDEETSLFQVGLTFIGILPPEFKQLVARHARSAASAE